MQKLARMLLVAIFLLISTYNQATTATFYIAQQLRRVCTILAVTTPTALASCCMYSILTDGSLPCRKSRHMIMRNGIRYQTPRHTSPEAASACPHCTPIPLDDKR